MRPDPATIPPTGRQARRARAAAGRKKHRHTFAADLKVYNEMDLENLAKTARLVLCDVGLYKAGSITWDYQGQTVNEAKVQMELVLKLVAAEERRRASAKQVAADGSLIKILEMPNGDPEDVPEGDGDLSSSEERRNRRLLDADEEDEDLGRGSR